MKTVAVLVLKDLRRAWRNPVAWVVFLMIPLIVTGLIGTVFGPKTSANVLGRVRFALVDEDDTGLSRLLKGGMNQGQGGEHLEPVFLKRDEALRLVSDNKLSAMVVIPSGFMRSYLTGTNIVHLELVKNPAESIKPAVLEELLGVVTTGLDALKRNFSEDLPQWHAVFEGEGDYHAAADLVVRTGDKLKAAKSMLWPPRVGYTNWSERSEESDKSDRSDRSEKAGFNIFGYLLPGLAAMFLLFLGEKASRDLHKETEQRTLQRFGTLHSGMGPFLASKVVFCLVFLMLCSAVLLAGGGLIFQIAWKQPLAVCGLTVCYCLFASGLMTLAAVLIGNPGTGQALGNILAMVLGMAGGSTFPVENMPSLFRNYISPLMPNYWYLQGMRGVLQGGGAAEWSLTALKIGVVGVLLMLAAVFFLRRNVERGLRA
jgi:ABC-type multidrug transport system permease subunit